MDAGVNREIGRQSVIAFGRTWPNPSVACVIASGGHIFAGATEKPGSRHAEIAALDEMDRTLGRDAPGDLYVTLEPCSRFGRTPPCTERLRHYPNLRVHVGAMDPTLRGDGIRLLREAGLTVFEEQFGAPFVEGFTGRARGIGPRFHLKVSSRDGVMGHRSARMMISSEDGFAFGHLLRSKLDAILVGPRTIEVDRPRLDARVMKEPGFQRVSGEDPLIDALLSNAKDAFDSLNQPARVFILGRPFAGAEEWLDSQKRLAESTGREAVFLSIEPWPNHSTFALPPMSHPSFNIEIRDVLADQGFNEVLVEGGAGLFSALLPGLGPRDRLYHLERKGEAGDLEGTVRVPSGLLAGKSHAVYRAAEETMGVYRFGQP